MIYTTHINTLKYTPSITIIMSYLIGVCLGRLGAGRVQLICINQQMSDNEDFAFGDDWQAEAEAVIEQIKNEQPSQPEPEQQDSPQTEEAPKEKLKVIDPKQALLARLAHSSALSDDKFQDYLEEVKNSSTNTEFKGSTQILKSDKDFAQFARAVGKRFNDQLAEAEADSLDESNVFQFVDQLLVLLYRGFQYQNFFHINKKLEAVMGERKKEEKQAKKRKQKEERQKKQQKLEQKQETNDAKKEQPQQEQDDIFGGATFVNSKQLQEERKNKEKAKVEAPPKPAEEDDDDFM